MQLKKAIWFFKTKLLGLSYGGLGTHSYVGPATFIEHRSQVFIGNNVRIYPGMRIELPSKDSLISIKDNVSIGQNFHAVSYKKNLVISSGVVISANVFISNVNHNYKKLGISALKQELISRDTKIGENCFIGYGAVILPGTHLGKQCIVGANAVVHGTFDDYSVIAGVPARTIKKYDKETKKWRKVENV